MQSRRGPSSPESDSASVTFQDVAARFSEEEWKLLHQWQEELYNNLMWEIHQSLNSLGPVIASSVFSLRAKENEDLCPKYDRYSERRHKITSSRSLITPGEDVFNNSREETQYEKELLHTDRRESSDNLDTGPKDTIKEEEETDPTASQGPKKTQHMHSPAGYISLVTEPEVRLMDPVAGEGREGSTGLSSGGPVATSELSQSFFHNNDTLLKKKEEEEEEEEEEDGGESSGDPIATCVFSQSFLHNSETLLKEEEDEMVVVVVEEDVEEEEEAHDDGGECSAHKSEMGGMNEMEPNTLSGCKKTSTFDVTLKQHQRIQTSERLFPCTECERIFKTKGNLVAHEIIHKGLKPYTCTDCKKSFTFRQNLKRHQRIHTGERPFPCTECKKSFTCRTNLSRHFRIHTGVRPFSCTECEKSFTQKTSLQSHQRTHRGLRAFFCTECEKSFTQKTSLQSHLETHRSKALFFH